MTGIQSAPASARTQRPGRSFDSSRRSNSKAVGSASNAGGSYSKPDSSGPGEQPRPEPKILGQFYFKSVGPRTYASQVKEAANGNHFIVLTEGRRDKETGDVRKTRLLVFSEDFESFFKMLEDTARFIKANPVPEEVQRKQERFWAKKGSKGADAR